MTGVHVPTRRNRRAMVRIIIMHQNKERPSFVDPSQPDRGVPRGPVRRRRCGVGRGRKLALLSSSGLSVKVNSLSGEKPQS